MSDKLQYIPVTENDSSDDSVTTNEVIDLMDSEDEGETQSFLQPKESFARCERSEQFNFFHALAVREGNTESFATPFHALASSVSDKIARFDNNSKQQSCKLPPYPALKSRPSRKNYSASTSTPLGVYLRVRPLPAARGTSTTNTLEIQPPINANHVPTTIRTYPPVDSNAAKVLRNTDKRVKEFQFSHVFGPDSSQQDLYSTVAAPLVTGLFPNSNSQKPVGESALLFAYGITNAGKTHTIMGNVTEKESSIHWGIIPRALQDIFAHMENFNSISSTTGYKLNLSYMEIYNEQVYDLLPEKSTKPNSTTFGNGTALKLQESQDGQIFCRGLSKHLVKNVAHGLQLAQRAGTMRHTSSNDLNLDSSRSHCICQLELSFVDSVHPAVVTYNDDKQVTDKTVTLWIVDLAGSERSKRTGVMQGSVQQKEAAIINLSHMKLMRCLSVMQRNQSLLSSSTSSSSNNNEVVPFRESKLTHLFKDHLTGPCAKRTVMVVNVNPADADFDETQHVLAYATAARTVQISQEEFQRKRKDMNGGGGVGGGDLLEATHDNNGRALKRFKSTKEPAAVVKPSNKNNNITRLVRHFPPKKFMARTTTWVDERKRKVEHKAPSKEVCEDAIRLMVEPLHSNAAMVAEEIKCLRARVESIARMPEEESDVLSYKQVSQVCQVAKLEKGKGVSFTRLHFINRELINNYMLQGQKGNQEKKEDYGTWNTDQICTNDFRPVAYRSTRMPSSIKPKSYENVDRIQKEDLFVWLKCLSNVSSNNAFLRVFYDLPSEQRETIKREFDQLSKQFKRIMSFQMTDEETCSWDDLNLGAQLDTSQNGKKMVHVGPIKGPATSRYVLLHFPKHARDEEDLLLMREICNILGQRAMAICFPMHFQRVVSVKVAFNKELDKWYFCAQFDTGREGTGHALFSNQGNEYTGDIISPKECHNQLFEALAFHNAFLGKAHNNINPDNLFVMEVTRTHEDSQPEGLRLFLTNWGDSGSTVGTLRTMPMTSAAYTPLSVLLGQSKEFLPYSRDTHCAVIVVLEAAIGMRLIEFMKLKVPDVFRDRMMKLWKRKERAHILKHFDNSESILVQTTYALLVATENREMQILSAAETRWPDLYLRETMKNCKEFDAHILEFSLRMNASKLAKKVLEQNLDPLELARGLHPDPSLTPTAWELLGVNM